ncbi:hypothetical protein ETU10_08665 [Apibacter muscae]|uniref:tyrosine-type recombinase/integrase n=1 Tax=Apibacter muscae TaxID=2509004 RepID=UPI0011AC2807|nr:site-specific integrase [Apibacter muscae]TWP23158.1 hypothetical protein ETU10_08665 [Apibacter muscae]
MSLKLFNFKKVPLTVPLMKPYTIKIYDAKGDVSKDWYIRWFLRDKESGKLVRQTNIKAGCNRLKTANERYTHLRKIIMLMEYKLNKVLNEKEEVKKIDESILDELHKTNYSLEEAFNYFISIKTSSWSNVTLRDYKSVYKIFSTFLEKNKVDTSNVNNITRKYIIVFLNERHKETSARTRNNNQINLKAFWEFLKNEEICNKNILDGIPKVKTTAQTHKIYTPEQFDSIISEIEKIDNQLALYIKFVAYLFVRPVENCRILIGNIDMKHRTIVYKSKTKDQKVKYIIDLIYKDLEKIHINKYDKDFNLFTPDGKPSLWIGKEESKRQYFTELYKDIIKSNPKLISLGLTDNHDMYSFRHTGIMILYRSYRKTLSPFETKSKLMLITGHTTMSALEKYLRTIDAELPEDYSKKFNI